MDKNIMIVIGMLISYVASLFGLICAWIYYNKRHKKEPANPDSGK